jgi:hypothetical protein
MTIRVLARDLPQMLHDIIAHAIAAEPDMALEPASAPTAPDVVIVGTTDAAQLAGVAALLVRWPESAVIAIEPDGRNANFFELRPHRARLGEISPTDLIRLIREKASTGTRGS